MHDLDVVDTGVATMSHRQMVAAWRLGRAYPVSPRITDYAYCDGSWWRRGGGEWTSIPDGPFAMSLTAGRERLWSLTGGLDADRHRDPWSVARNRLRTSAICGRRS
jgi:hypothetical protein